MSSPSISTLSAGVQQLYNKGLLPTSLATSTLNKSSASQLNQLANLSVASQEAGALFGTSSDSTSLSSTATNALLQEINPTATTASSTPTDPLTAAIDNALLAPGTAAANQFLPQSTTTGSQIDVLG